MKSVVLSLIFLDGLAKSWTRAHSLYLGFSSPSVRPIRTALYFDQGSLQALFGRKIAVKGIGRPHLEYLVFAIHGPVALVAVPGVPAAITTV
jgi:hypothetical protein